MEPEDPTPAIEYAADCARHGLTDLLLDLLDAGYPVDHPDAGGNTPLMLAAYHGHPATVTALLARGADPDRLNARGQAPVAGALFRGEEEVVRLLVEAGADLDHGHPTARDAAALFGSGQLLAGS
jgi:ankyrin repeat protein